MQVQNSKFHKVWESENKGKYTKIKFGDSKKKQDGTYENCTWMGILVGKAHETGLNQGDKFNIVSGQIFSSKGTNGTWYTSVTVFEIEVTERAELLQDSFVNIPSETDFVSIEDDDDIPF